ncbi:MAG: ABC transporter ATP-binding protein [Candidatus Krumholzibacteriota bacterium]|nr:ABC transporter ATP-binding protein [Candidatus Krumholzibacteriota bacterium]
MRERGSGRLYFRLLSYLKPFWRRLLLLFLCTSVFAVLSGVSLTLIPPFLHILFSEQAVAVSEERGGSEEGLSVVPKEVEDRIEGVKSRFRELIYRGTPVENLARFCVLFFILMIIKNVFGYLSTYLTIYLEQTILHKIRTELYSRIQMLPLSFFDREKSGHLISRITNDVTNLRGTIVGSLASLIRNSLMTVIAAVIIFYTSWKLSLLTVIILPLNVFLISVISGKLRKSSRMAQERMADMTSVIQETVFGVRVVKAFRMERSEKIKFDLFSMKYLKEYLRMRRFAELASPGSEMLALVASVVILWYGGKLVIGGSISPADLMMFIVAMLWVAGPVKNLSRLNNVVQVGLASGERVFELLDMPGEDENPPGAEITGIEREIVYENVSFSYEKGVEVLSGIDLKIRKGEMVALAGPSGAGKSTVADLLPRFYIPSSGRIMIDGNDISSFDLNSLRSLIGVVTQETILFNDTIFNNITYGDSAAGMEKVVEASKAANAHGFISAMPNGYDTIVGDRGAQLSGGERQRLAIARALLKDPKILILDEATSALDVESEQLVREAIDRLVEGRTTLVIGHRVSTIRKADLIAVIKDGKIRQSGIHDKLINEDGIYKKFYGIQSGLSS